MHTVPQSLPPSGESNSLEQHPPRPTQFIVGPFVVRMIEASPIHPFSSSYVVYIQWTLYHDPPTANEVPELSITVSALTIREALAPSRVTGFHSQFPHFCTLVL